MRISYTTIKRKRNFRPLYLALSGIAVLGSAYLLTNRLFAPDNSVYEPIVVSSYNASKEPEPANEQPPSNIPKAPEAEPVEEPPEWPITYSMEQANSLTVVVNKKHRLPSNYVPELTTVEGGQLRPVAATALQSLMDDAEAAGAPMVIVSSYRSYQTQVSTYQYWVDTQGQLEADRGSARPGHSEHQTGLTADMGNPDGSCRLLACFGDGVAGTWLKANAHKYGFIIRYPENKESITGYIYEPWHIRYLGTEVAKAVYASGQTLDEYYGIAAGMY